jgi:hypothetical protein
MIVILVEIVFTFIFYPGFKMVSITPHKINLSPSLTPLCGTMLGPFYGPIVILSAKSLYLLINPKAAYFGVFSVLPITLGTIVAGYLSEGNWKRAAIIMLVGLLLWYLTQVGRTVYYYPFMSIIGLMLILHLKEKIYKMMFDKNPNKSIFGTTVLSFCSVMTDHIYGSFLGIWYLNLPANVYIEAIPHFIKERMIMTLFGAIFTVMVIYLTKRIIEYGSKIRDRILNEYIEEYIKNNKNDDEVDPTLLEKYNVRYPSQDEQKEILKKFISQMNNISNSEDKEK